MDYKEALDIISRYKEACQVVADHSSYAEGTFIEMDSPEGDGRKIKVSTKKQTQPSNLGDKLAFPSNEEMMLIEKLRLEETNKRMNVLFKAAMKRIAEKEE